MQKLILTAILLFFFTESFSGVGIIHGVVKNFTIQYAVIEKPINGYYNNVSIDTIRIINNRFTTRVNCWKPVFVTILFGGHPVRFIIQPGDTISFKIDFSHKDKANKIPISITGSNAAGQRYFYDYNYWPVAKYEYVWTFLKEEPRQLSKNISKEILRQNEPFKKLYLNKKVNKGYYELVSSTISSLLLFETIRKILDRNLKEIKFSNMLRRQIAEELFKLHNPNDVTLFYGLNSSLYAELFLSFKRSQLLGLDTYTIDLFPDTTVNFENKTFQISGNFSSFLDLANSKIKERIFGAQLLNYLSMGGSNILKDEIDYFKAIYPESSYLSLIENLKVALNKHEENQIQQQRFLLTPIAILDSIGETNTLFSKFNFFDNEIVYVDVWATWCTPCIQEMKFNYQIDSFLHANKMKRLYISIDGLQDTLKWKKIISDLNLGGYHIIANDTLQKFLSKRFGLGNNLLAIPIYFVINRGNITVKEAFRPSEFEKLKNQLIKEIEKKSP